MAKGPEPVSTDRIRIDWAHGPCCYTHTLRAPLDYILTDWRTHTDERVWSITEGTPIESAGHTQVTAAWAAQDPGGGHTTSVATVSITGHIQRNIIQISLFGWIVFGGSALLVMASLWFRKKRAEI